MEVTLIQGIILAVTIFIIGIDYLMEAFFIFRPIIVASVTGLILGDLTTGIICGGLAELAFAGLTPVGGTEPPDPITAGVMTAFIAITTDTTPAVALGLALPFSFLMQYVNMFIYSTFSFFMVKADKYAENGDAKGLVRMHIGTLSLTALAYAVIIFLCTFVAQNAMASFVESIPPLLLNGLNVAGGIMPAIGFSMLLVVLLKKEFSPYLILGFVGACFIPFGNILPIALLGVAFALIDFYGTDKKSTGGTNNGSGI